MTVGVHALMEDAELLFTVQTAHAKGGGVDVRAVIRLSEGVGHFVAIISNFAKKRMGDIEFEIGERGTEAISAFRFHLAYQLARFAVAEYIGDGELRLLISMQSQSAHHLDYWPVAVSPQRKMFFDFDQ